MFIVKVYRSRYVVLGIVAALMTVTPSAAASGALLPATAAITLSRQYFQDLSTHRYRAAYLREAQCELDLVVHPPNTTGRSTIGLPARAANMKAGAGALRFVDAAHVSGMRLLSTPLFQRYHLIGVQVSGTFRFSYPTHWTGNDMVPSGFHRITIIVRRCGTHWGIDAGWPHTFVQPGFGIGWR